MNTTKFVHPRKPLMVAHRGVSGLETENTHAAFVAAGNRSYYGIETDVHVTSDGKYVAFHDDETRRLAAEDVIIEQTDFATLRNMILSLWHQFPSPGSFPGPFPGWPGSGS